MSQSSPAQDPHDAYTTLRATHQHTMDWLIRRRNRALAAIGATLAAFLLFAFVPPARQHAAFTIALYAATFLFFALLIMVYLNLQGAIDAQARLLAHYDTSLRRVDGIETQTGRTGSAPVTHLYARDLDVVGPDSLFGLLATVRTSVGERGLLGYLLEPVEVDTARARQQAVRELAPQTALRERIALLGSVEVERISAGLVDDWIKDPPPRFSRWERPVLAATALAAVLLIRSGIFGPHAFATTLPNLFAVLAVQAGICYWLRAKASPLATSARLQRSVRLLAEGLALMDASNFHCARLRELQASIRQPQDAIKRLKNLESLLAIVEQRSHGYFLPLSLLLAAGIQTAISLARWKHANAFAMQMWLAAWGEFEALNALATYAFEHPEAAWPELLDQFQPPTFEATALGHPLLAGAVANDVSLGASTRFYLISGSNMSGKSTLLRSMGVAAVMACAGAPVRAFSLRLSPLQLGASLALTDSLAEGRSKFRAEVERLSAIVQLSASSPVLFLVDEIFSGTNSADRRTAGAAVLDRLLANGAIGALSTHDLALTELANEANTGRNVHMASPDPDDPLAFDYKLKSGINRTSNALAIVRLMGL